MKYGKLVRDKIPDIIRGRGGNPNIHIATEEEYPTRLREKLQEETLEFLASNDPEELADILEVVNAFAKIHGLTLEDIEKMRVTKANARGQFNKRIVLEPN